MSHDAQPSLSDDLRRPLGLLSVVILTTVAIHAFTAVAPPRLGDNGVLLIVGMAVYAMRLKGSRRTRGSGKHVLPRLCKDSKSLLTLRVGQKLPQNRQNRLNLLIGPHLISPTRSVLRIPSVLRSVDSPKSSDRHPQTFKRNGAAGLDYGDNRPLLIAPFFGPGAPSPLTLHGGATFTVEESRGPSKFVRIESHSLTVGAIAPCKVAM